MAGGNNATFSNNANPANNDAGMERIEDEVADLHQHIGDMMKYMRDDIDALRREVRDEIAALRRKERDADDIKVFLRDPAAAPCVGVPVPCSPSPMPNVVTHEQLHANQIWQREYVDVKALTFGLAFVAMQVLVIAICK